MVRRRLVPPVKPAEDPVVEFRRLRGSRMACEPNTPAAGLDRQLRAEADRITGRGGPASAQPAELRAFGASLGLSSGPA